MAPSEEALPGLEGLRLVVAVGLAPPLPQQVLAAEAAEAVLLAPGLALQSRKCPASCERCTAFG